MTNLSFSATVSKATALVSFTVIALLFTLLPEYARAQVSVSISPSTATLATLATQPLTATVSGSTNTTVTWQVSGVNGGNTTTGLGVNYSSGNDE